MPMTAKQRGLVVIIGVGFAGLIAGVELYAPAPDTRLVDLIDAGVGDCPLRAVRCIVRMGPQAPVRYRTVEANVRVCGGDPIFRQAPPPGATVLACRSLAGTPTEETDSANVTDECVCPNTVGACTALDTADKPTPIRRTLPRGQVAGASYRYNTPIGAGCVPLPCMELNAGEAWPAGCPL
jgi:hypothetical protein